MLKVAKCRDRGSDPYLFEKQFVSVQLESRVLIDATGKVATAHIGHTQLR